MLEEAKSNARFMTVFVCLCVCTLRFEYTVKRQQVHRSVRYRGSVQRGKCGLEDQLSRQTKATVHTNRGQRTETGREISISSLFLLRACLLAYRAFTSLAPKRECVSAF